MEPKNLKSTALDLNNLMFNMPWQIRAEFYKTQLNRVKRNLGKDCTFLAHEKRRDGSFVKAILLNDLGGKDEVYIEVAPFMSEEGYSNLQKTLGERLYDRSTKTV